MNKMIQEEYSVGLKKIIKHGREAFRISENLEYYSKEDYKRAEKKYLKICIIGGKC